MEPFDIVWTPRWDHRPEPLRPNCSIVRVEGMFRSDATPDLVSAAFGVMASLPDITFAVLSDPIRLLSYLRHMGNLAEDLSLGMRRPNGYGESARGGDWRISGSFGAWPPLPGPFRMFGWEPRHPGISARYTGR